MQRLIYQFVFVLVLVPTACGQNDQPLRKLVVCGGGALPDVVFQRFRKLAGEQPRLVVIPTASRRNTVLKEVQKLWRSRGFQQVQVLHSDDRRVASSSEFV